MSLSWRLAAVVSPLLAACALMGANPDPALAAAEALPPYRPQEQVSGTIRLWGHGSTSNDFMRQLVTRWERRFVGIQPGVSIEYRMYGTASAIGALYEGAGDLAILGEELFPASASAYTRAMGYPAAGVEIATGSLDVRNFDFAQMVFVNRDNPLSRLTLAQLDAIFGTERRRGAKSDIRTWGDLGLTGGWAGERIHLYGWSLDNDFWIFLSETVFGGSHRFKDGIREYAHIHRPDGTIYDAGQQILEALAKDPRGIALSNRHYLNPKVKPLALAVTEAGPFVPATRENLISRAYPLTRIIPAYFNQAPGRPVDPAVREFLRYILSRDGQEDIARDGEYLPLSPKAAAAALARLDGMRPGVAAPASPPVPAPGPDVIRIRGGGQMEAVLRAWEDGFQKSHPQARFENRLLGSGTAIAGLYTGNADLAFLGRSVTPVEVMAFAWVLRHPPSSVAVTQGSVDLPGKSPALAVWVNRQNPISRLTLAQLDSVFGCELRGGAPRRCRTWGDLGLLGDWARRPIHAYGYDVETGTGAFFRDTVLRGSRKWAWEALKEFRAVNQPGGGVLTADRQIADAVSADPGGIGVGNFPSPGDGVRAVAIAADEGSSATTASRETVVSGTYPLARTAWVYFNREPGTPLNPKVREFLEYVLGPEGQAAVERAGGFLPLCPARAEKERRTLD